jgi:hypothetical protein
LGLDADCKPVLPEFSHGGASVSYRLREKHMKWAIDGRRFLFRKKIFETLPISTYFEGYGLYEDADFTLRVSIGKLYVNTSCQAKSSSSSIRKAKSISIRKKW